MTEEWEEILKNHKYWDEFTEKEEKIMIETIHEQNRLSELYDGTGEEL